MRYQSIKRLLIILIVVVGSVFWWCSCSGKPPNPRQNQGTSETKQSARQSIVCIDPGHPSEVNSGATVQNGTTEVHSAWVVALKLKQLLEAKGFKVIMTKSREDELVYNKARAEIGNSSGAELMVRLHCDTGQDNGFVVYFPDRQATKGNTTGPSHTVIEKSKLLAQTISHEMAKGLTDALKDGGVRGDSETAIGSKQGALTASIFSEIPIVTVEMVVLSNKANAEFIKSEAGQERMAQAIATGIGAFINNLEMKQGSQQ